MTGSEVVEPNLHAERADLVEHRANLFRLADVRRLDDFEIQFRDVAEFLQARDDRSFLELPRREIDVEAYITPRRGIATRLLHHPRIETKHFRAFLSAGGDRFGIANFSASSSRSQQRLGRDDLARFELVNGLIERHELFLIERATNSGARSGLWH